MVFVDASIVIVIIISTKRTTPTLLPPIPLPLLQVLRSSVAVNCKKSLLSFTTLCNALDRHDDLPHSCRISAVDRRRRRRHFRATPANDFTGIRVSRSFWQPHKIVKAITITLLAAVAAIKRPSRCIAVA